MPSWHWASISHIRFWTFRTYPWTEHLAAKVLKGEKKASEMNFEVIEEAAFYGNSKVAENLGITLPQELTDSAAAIFDEITQ